MADRTQTRTASESPLFKEEIRKVFPHKKVLYMK